MPVHVHVIRTDYDDPLYREARGAAKDHTGMLNDLVRDGERNRLILATIMREYDPSVRRPMLLLTERRDAVDYWHRVLNERGIKTGIMLGGAASRKASEETRRGMISGTVDCAVATVQIAGEGMDIKELSRMFITTPMARHWRRAEQVIGRLKRIAHGKTDAKAFYFWDHRIAPGDLRALRKHFENVVEGA
jgi:superfamily II DNA or RNA helicase